MELTLEQLDNDSLKSFTNLIDEFSRRDITLVCGAGLSVSAGLPTWNNYLKKIHIKHIRNKKFFKKTHRYEPHNCGISASIIYEENNDISNVIAKICEQNA
jgi:NAD-dependent SIR2 family protein deacetylase